MPLIGSGFVRMTPSSTSPGTPISRSARPKSPFNEGDYVGASDSGSTFRISGCQYIYNLDAKQLGPGVYEVSIEINSAQVSLPIK